MDARDEGQRRRSRAPQPLGLARNGLMAFTTAARSISADPLTFGVQLARRFPKARSPLVALAGAVTRTDRELAQAWIGGDLAEARSQIEELADAGPLSRLAAEIAQAAGLPDLVVDDPHAPLSTRARAAWQLGEATRAIAMLAEERQHARLHRMFRAELALMTPGTRLRWTRSASRDPGTGSGILHLLTNSLPHTQSGYTLRSHAVLRAQRDAGLAPTAMTRIGYPVIVGGLAARSHDDIDGIRYVRALPARLSPTPDGRLVQQADALAAVADRVRPAALQTTTHYPNAVVVREVAAALGLPWAYEVRGMLEQTWAAGLASERARERARASERFRLTREREAELAEAADVVFTLSGSMREDLAERGVPRARIELVPNGVDASLLHANHDLASAADARAALGLPRDGFWVGSTSSLVDYEGFDVLVDAVRLARDTGADVRLLLVGDGTARRALESRAARAGLGEAAVFAGRVPRSEVAAHRVALDLFVVPRLDRDVTRTVSPLKPIEAMASGVPLVVSALPPLLEVIGDALTAVGAAVPAGDADALSERIIDLAQDPEARERIVELGRARAASRTWPAIGAIYQRAFDAIGAESRVWHH